MPTVLDLFSGDGGAGEGYRRAGFTVVGVDIEPHSYPVGRFIQADVMIEVQDILLEVQPDAIHASPPCQGYSTMTGAARSRHARLISPVRDMLLETGLPYVIENVVGARSDMHSPVMLCGSSFGLKVRRHRLFESNVVLAGLSCNHAAQGRAVGVYGAPEKRQYYRADGSPRNRKASGVEEAREAMGIDWMTWADLTEAIPPAFTEYLGTQLRAHLSELEGEETTW